MAAMDKAKIDNAPAETERSLVTGVLRGLKHRCPECGEGRLFRAYLKVDEFCEACGHPLGQYRADDGPAYLTILVIGHLLVAPLMLFPFIWQWPAHVVLPLTLIPLAAAVLLMLPRIKGAWLGLMWSLKQRSDDAHEGAPQV